MNDDLIRKRGEPGPEHDPVNLMHQIFEEAEAFVGPAQDVLLSWLIKLPQRMEPAKAAGLVLDNTVAHSTGEPSEEASKLIGLLQQVREHGDINATAGGSGRRRGGRSARVDNRTLQ